MKTRLKVISSLVLSVCLCGYVAASDSSVNKTVVSGLTQSGLSSGSPMGAASQGFDSKLYRSGKVEPNGYSIDRPDTVYREKSMRPSVMDAPPAWAQEKLPASSSLSLAPFGANLFQGNFAGTYSDGINDDYIVMTGDRVVVRVWGAKTYDDILTVDQRGNLFLPEVGPVKVAGIRHSELQNTVRRKLSEVYTRNVHIYVNLQSSQPVAVYVTGFVARPGRYAGSAVDSVMSYLDRAGGIEPSRGTYRDISVMREGKRISSLDLYDFSLNGCMPKIRLKDGDVILVSQRKASVAAYGTLRNEARFEFKGKATGDEVVRYGVPLSTTSHVSISGVRNGTPFNQYMSLNDFRKMTLSDGDVIEFVADIRGKTIMASASGAIQGESRFPVKSSTRLRSLLSFIQIDPTIADTGSVYVRRHSVAVQQKAILQDSLKRLEQSALTATSATNEEAQIRVREAELIQDFVKRAAQLTPDGVVVVCRNGQVNDLLLEDGDEIVIPQKSDVIQVTGEVMLPKAVTFDSSMDVKDYIKSSGGFTDRANKSNILIARMNGEVGPAGDMGIRSGDRILVLPKVDTKNVELARGISQILYQIAVAAKVAMDL